MQQQKVETTVVKNNLSHFFELKFNFFCLFAVWYSILCGFFYCNMQLVNLFFFSRLFYIFDYVIPTAEVPLRNELKVLQADAYRKLLSLYLISFFF